MEQGGVGIDSPGGAVDGESVGIDGLGGAWWMERGARWGCDPPVRAAPVVGAPPCHPSI